MNDNKIYNDAGVSEFARLLDSVIKGDMFRLKKKSYR